MADSTELNPFDPTKQGEDTNALVDQWRGYLADPAARSALLSSGLQMMQPMGFGQTPMGHIGQAIGQAGESARTSEAIALKNREASSKEELRAAQAGAAEARAGAAGSAANAAETRMKLEGLRQEGTTQRNLLNARVRLSQNYQNYVNLTNKANNDPLAATGTQQPIMSYPDWLSSKGLSELIGTGSQSVSPDGAPTSGARPRPKPGDVVGGRRFKGGDPQ